VITCGACYLLLVVVYARGLTTTLTTTLNTYIPELQTTDKFHLVTSEMGAIVREDMHERKLLKAAELKHPSPQSESRVSPLTLILTESRHGSSWLLSVVGRPDNVLHFYEPLQDEIHDMFRNYHPELGESGVQALYRATKLAQICRCQFYRYDGGPVSETFWARNYVERRSREEAAFDCKFNRTTRVVKTIRLYDVTDLELLPELGCLDFRVIHLIRDPRAVLVSRMLTFHELYDGNRVLGPRIDGPMEDFSQEYVGRAARDLCGHHLANMQHGAQEPWLKGRYTRLLYEDIVREPVGVVRRLFAFLGQPFTATDEEFVYASSHSNRTGGGYDVSKNSSHVLNEWKEKILPRHLEIIEESCKDVLLQLGYTFGIY